MKKSIQFTFIIIFLLFNILNCNSQENTSVDVKTTKNDKRYLLKSTFNLNDSEMSRIIKNDTITNELFLSLKDSTKYDNIKRRLNYFFSGKYDSKKLVLAIKLERLFENGSFEFSDSIDHKKVRHYKDVNKLNTFIKNSEKEITKELNKKIVKDTVTNNKQ